MDHCWQALEDRGGYVVGVRTDQRILVGAAQVRVRELLAEVPAGGWQRLSCGDGAKGPRWYDWARHAINGPAPNE